METGLGPPGSARCLQSTEWGPVFRHHGPWWAGAASRVPATFPLRVVSKPALSSSARESGRRHALYTIPLTGQTAHAEPQGHWLLLCEPGLGPRGSRAGSSPPRAACSGGDAHGEPTAAHQE